MSFAFKGSDQVKPAPGKHPVKSSAPPTTEAHPVKRSSGGYVNGTAANAKFAHRLRSTDENDNTVRPSSRARKSLPPALTSQPALSAGNAKANQGANGRVTPVAKPAWNASTALIPDKRAPTPSARKARNTAPLGNGNAKEKRYLRAEMTASPIEDSSVAGLWTAFQERAEETPDRRTAVLAGKQMGGRI